MPQITTPVPGTFCWFEIATSDVLAAQSFFGELFSWSFKDMPAMPDGSAYAIAQARGVNVCGVTPLMGDAKNQGIPPHLLAYVAVTDPDALAKKVPSLGGTVLAQPMDAGPGRMAIIQDPTGGVLALWKEKESMGPWLYNEPLALCWNELLTNNVDTAARFYTSLFGWKKESSPKGGAPYTLFKSGKTTVAGMMAMPNEMRTSHSSWVAYLRVENADETLTRAQKLGGKIFSPLTSTPTVGRYAMLHDPQGAVFAILQAELHK